MFFVIQLYSCAGMPWRESRSVTVDEKNNGDGDNWELIVIVVRTSGPAILEAVLEVTYSTT